MSTTASTAVAAAASTISEATRRSPVRPPAVPMPDLLRRRPAALTVVLLGLTVAVFAAEAWQRRWISDDGLIFLRTVRQILAGEGPVFNAGERVEANTSTLWTVVLLGLAALPVRLELVSVFAGLVVSVLAMAVALDAARRFSALGRVAVPAGALVVLAVPPFWDFATSGLETSLSWLWLAAVWWLLVHRSQRAPRLFVERAARRRPGRAWPLALIIGLGPLVRPDLAVVSVVGGAALLVLEQPRTPRAWSRMAGLLLTGAALPAAYEVVRAGYYGLLVPATALAKEAGEPRWDRGLAYLRDMVGTYWLGVPALALAVAAVALARPLLVRARVPVVDPVTSAGPVDSVTSAGPVDSVTSAGPVDSVTSAGPVDSVDVSVRRTRTWDRVGTAAVALTPPVGGALMVGYVVRVGGDFMHARMLLPAVFCLLLPAMALPLRRLTWVPVLTVLVWAIIAVHGLRPPYHGISGTGIADERGFYTELLGDTHPMTSDDYRRHPYMLGGVTLLERARQPTLALQVYGTGPAGPEWTAIPLRPGRPDRIVWLNLGVAGALAPLDVRVSDTIGLATPLAAHTTGIPIGRVGHDKNLPPAWFVAMDGGIPPDRRTADPGDIASATRALQCPALQELDASVHAPLTPERFWANLTGAYDRTQLRFPRDPVLAELACP